MDKYKLKQKILIPFLLSIIILVGISISGVHYLMRTEIEILTKDKTDFIFNEFELKKNKEIELMTATILTLQHNIGLQKIWIEKDRNKLLRVASDLFENIKKNTNITHFYFHDTSRINYLRVHKPNMYGDLIERYTLRDARDLKSITSGIEIGTRGTFTLRVVSPWYIKNELIGYVELGEEIGAIVEQVHKIAGVELFVLYNKNFIDKNKFEKGMEVLKKNGNWSRFKNWVMLYSTQNWIPKIFKKYDVERISESIVKNYKFKYLDNEYIVKSVKILDAGEREVAEMLILTDSTLQFKNMRSISYLISGIALLIGLILFIIFYLVLRQTEKSMFDAQQRILEETAKREKIQKEHVQELLNEHKKLLDSESRFQTIVTHSVPIIFVFDTEGIIQLSEGKMLSNLGLKPGEVVGQNVFELYKDFPKTLSVFRSTLKGETFEGGLEIKGRFLESFVSPNKDSEGIIIGAIGISLDITDRKETDDKFKKQTENLEKSNEELKKSRMAALSIMQDANLQKEITEKALSELEISTLEFKKLSQAIEQANVSIMITKLNGEIEYVNAYFFNTTGYTYDETIGNTPKMLQSGKHPKEMYRKLWETITNGNIWKGEFENRKKNGELYWDSTTISPVVNNKNKITHFVAVKEDITQKKKIEQELREAKITAEAATEAKSQFLASMSHEIRTPMNAIIGLSYLALNTALNPKQLDYLSKIDSSAKSLLRIINDILDFSKIEAGELTIESINFDLESVVSSVTNFISQRVFEKRLELIVHIAPDVPLDLIGDPLRLAQVLTNFCNNAVKFTQKGEIIIEITLVTEDEDNAELLFAVKDTGIGIKENEKDKLFKAFQQADTSTTREFGGTGLGLVISQNLAKLMNGDIWFESEENKGSVFYFSIILKKQITQHFNQNSLLEELTGMKVLLLNINSTMNNYLFQVLESFSFRVHVASSEQDAINELEKSVDKPYGLVITDYQELKATNFETLNTIKNKYNLPIIMLVAPYLQEKIVEVEIIELVNLFLVKPFNYSELFNTIMELFGKLGSRSVVISDDKNLYQEELEEIRGSLILLAEDNEINQQVAIEMLEAVDIQVEVASNGLQAVDMVKKSGIPSKYSLVLMDIQMPEMDGYDATTEIKKLKDYKNLPIIAMTADAMSDVREKCLKVGMVDYLTKPIEPDVVLEALIKWLEPKNKLVATNKPKPYRIFKKNKNRKNIEIPQIDGVNINDALKYVAKDRRLLVSLLKKFIDNANFEEKINKALKNDDKKEVFRLIHTLKGNAGLLGMNRLRDITNKAQTALHKDENLDVSDFIVEILTELTPILNSLKLVFSNEEDDENNKLSFIEEVKEKLDKLKSLIELHDMEAVNLIKDIGSIVGFEEETIELNKSISNYQFEKALEILQKIKS